MQSWNRLLADARRGVGLTQAELADQAGISEETVKAYELGRRRPSPMGLHRLLTILSVDWRRRNDILMRVGFLTEPLWSGGRTSVARYLTVEEACDVVALRPWPALLLNEKVELLAMNRTGFRILPVPPERLLHPVDRNLLTMVTHQEIGRRLVNWKDTVSRMIALFKAHVHRAESLDEPSAYLSAVLARVYEGDARLVRQFIDLWEATPSDYPEKVTWTYSVIWDVREVGRIRFRGVVNSVNEAVCLDIDDWIPEDAESFRRLEDLFAGGDAASNVTENPGPNSA